MKKVEKSGEKREARSGERNKIRKIVDKGVGENKTLLDFFAEQRKEGKCLDEKSGNSLICKEGGQEGSLKRRKCEAVKVVVESEGDDESEESFEEENVAERC